MRANSLRGAVLITTAVILVLLFGLLVWRLAFWNERGMVGMIYHPPESEETERTSAIQF